MCPNQLRHLLNHAVERGLVQAGKIINGTVLLQLLGDWVDMDEQAAACFLQTLLSIEADSKRWSNISPGSYA